MNRHDRALPWLTLMRGLALALSLALCPLRLAATVIQQTPAITPFGTWGGSLNVTPPTVPSGQYLERVEFVLQGSITGYVGIENLDSVLTQTLNARYSATLTLSLANSPGTLLANIFPAYTTTQTLPKFDATQDFAGTSGVTLQVPGGSASATTTTSFADPDILALFGGTSAVPLSLPGVTLTAAQNLAVSGQGGKIPSTLGLNSADGSASLTINYYYAEIPEPACLLLLGLGALGGLYRRPRRRAAVPR